MTNYSEFQKGVNDFFSGEYNVTNTDKIPDVKDLAFGKTGKKIDLALLFIDMRESTKIMSAIQKTTAARIYKSFLWGLSKIALENKGEVRSFNGDGVLVVFSGTAKCNNAVKAALEMKYFCTFILKPKADNYLKDKIKLDNTLFDFGIGVDVGTILVVRGGIRGEKNNDLVWVGDATNTAVKLSGLSSDPYNICISDAVYKLLNNSRKFDGVYNIWMKNFWNSRIVYNTSYHWTIR